MIRLASVIADFEADFLAKFRHRLSFDQLRALSALRHCRGPENGRVTFRYRNAETGKLEQRSLGGADFLWLILQHVLPKGFRRARSFGFLHANCKRVIGLLHLLLKFDPGRFAPPPRERPPMLCACCGAATVIVGTRIRSVLPGVVIPPPVVGAERETMKASARSERVISSLPLKSSL